jgi:hypothetical protein
LGLTLFDIRAGGWDSDLESYLFGHAAASWAAARLTAVHGRQNQRHHNRNCSFHLRFLS